MFVAIKVDNAGVPVNEKIVVFDIEEDLNTFLDSKVSDTGGYWKTHDAVTFKEKQNIDKYIGGFTIRGDEPFMTEDWLLREILCNRSKLVFYGYDANMNPMKLFSKWPETDWKQKVIDKALEFTKDFNGAVWLDDVCVKEGSE